MFNKNIKKLGLLSRALGAVLPAVALFCVSTTDLRANEAELPAKVSVSNNRDARIHLVDDKDGSLMLINPVTSGKAEAPRTIVFLPPGEDAQVELVEGFIGRDVSGLRIYRESMDGGSWEDPDSEGFPMVIIDSTSGIAGPIRPAGLSADDTRLFSASCADGDQGPCEFWVLERRSDCPVTLPGGYREPVLLDGNMCVRDDDGVCTIPVTSVSESHILSTNVSGQAGEFGAGDVFVTAGESVLRYLAEDIAEATNPDAGNANCPAGDEITPETLIGPAGSGLGIAQGADGDAWSGFDFNPVVASEMLIQNDSGTVRVFDLDGGAFGEDFVTGLDSGDAKIDAELDHLARAAAYMTVQDSNLALKFLIGMDEDGNTVAVDENGDPTSDPIAPYPVNTDISVPSDVSATNFVVVPAEMCQTEEGCNGTGLVNHQIPDDAMAEGNVAEAPVITNDPRECTADGERLSIQDLDMNLPDVDVTPEICGQPQVAIVETIAPGVVLESGVIDNEFFGAGLMGGELPCWEPGVGGEPPAFFAQTVGLYGPRPGMEPDIFEYLDGDPELIELTSGCGSGRLKSKGLSLFGVNWVFAPDTDMDQVIADKLKNAHETLRVSACDLDEVSEVKCVISRIILSFHFTVMRAHWEFGNKQFVLFVLDLTIPMVENQDNAGVFNLGENNFQGDLDARLKNIAFTILTKDICLDAPDSLVCTTPLDWAVMDGGINTVSTTIRRAPRWGNNRGAQGAANSGNTRPARNSGRTEPEPVKQQAGETRQRDNGTQTRQMQ